MDYANTMAPLSGGIGGELNHVRLTVMADAFPALSTHQQSFPPDKKKRKGIDESQSLRDS
jgi:hypothetical protein